MKSMSIDLEQSATTVITVTLTIDFLPLDLINDILIIPTKLLSRWNVNGGEKCDPWKS